MSRHVRIPGRATTKEKRTDPGSFQKLVQKKLTSFDVMEPGYLPDPSNSTMEEMRQAEDLWEALFPGNLVDPP